MVKSSRHSKLFLLVLPCLVVGCGYSSRFKLPDGVRTVAVKVFKNDTLYRGVDLELTRELCREIRAKTELKMVHPKDADLVLSGKVSDYDLSVLREDAADNVEEYQSTVLVSYQWYDARHQKVLREGETRRVAQFNVTRAQTERNGRREVLREAAREIVSDCFEPWQ